jgi:hypothetical protein
MTHYTLQYDRQDDYCAIWDHPHGFDDQYRSAEGLRVGDLFDPAIAFRMAPQVRGKLVPDFIPQVIQQLLVSQRVAAILREMVTAEVEYFSVPILNHRGKAAANAVLVNPIGWYDCLDRTKTKGEAAEDLAVCEKATLKKKGLPKREYADDISPDDEYDEITRLVLHPERTPEVDLFRVSGYVGAIIFSEPLVAKLKAEKVTGARFVKLGQPVEL